MNMQTKHTHKTSFRKSPRVFCLHDINTMGFFYFSFVYPVLILNNELLTGSQNMDFTRNPAEVRIIGKTLLNQVGAMSTSNSRPEKQRFVISISENVPSFMLLACIPNGSGTDTKDCYPAINSNSYLA